jgi:hypothetical protein
VAQNIFEVPYLILPSLCLRRSELSYECVARVTARLVSDTYHTGRTGGQVISGKGHVFSTSSDVEFMLSSPIL